MGALPEYALGNQFVRVNHLEKVGDYIDGHAHTFDHNTIAMLGVIQVEWLNDDGSVKQSVVLRAGCGIGSYLVVKAGVRHKLTALEPHSEFHCTYAHRDPQGRVVQVYNGWDEANR